MPTLKWKLKNPKSCEGCPCLWEEFIGMVDSIWKCGKGYKRKEYIETGKKPKRPKCCIKALGE